MSIVEVVAEVCAREVTTMSRAEVAADAAAVARVAGWLDARRVAHARRLAKLAEAAPSLEPEVELATATRSGKRDAEAAVRRRRLLDDAPPIEDALGDGRVSGAHVDVLERAVRRLDEDGRGELLSDGQELALLAATITPEQFDRLVARRVRQLQTDGGTAEFERQRRDTSLRTWVDQRSGMVRLAGEFDPESGLMLRGRLELAMETLFHDREPDTCPADPELKQQHLRALALLALTSGSVQPTSIDRAGARTEVVVVIDLPTLIDGLHEQSIIDAGDRSQRLPVETYRRLGCAAGLIPAFVDSAGVVVDLGRTVRVASKAQRRALAAMYATCAVPGCDVRSRHCEPHHIAWWRNGGTTDLANLVPLCSRHHHAVHEGGWQVALDPARRLTITFPDGSVRCGGAPAQQRAGP